MDESTPPPRRRARPERDVAGSAGPRCLAYAACSELLASPHDIDPRPALRARRAQRLGALWSAAAALDAPLAALLDTDLAVLRRTYSGLFEVGDEGPPVPIREQLANDDRGGAREEVVRYYEHFGYVLGEQQAWQPDHLSVELEFVHMLCWHESQAAGAGAALPFQLAQADFTQRHLAAWTPALAAQVAARAPGSLYARVTRAIADFIVADDAWQRATLVVEGSAAPG